MKPKYPLRRFFMLSAIVIAGALLAPMAHAADLTHNAGSTLNLGPGAVSYDNVFVGSGGGNASTVVDATGTTSFTSNGTQFYVGAGPSGAIHIGTLNLGDLNTITANQVTIGGLQPDSNGSAGHAGRVTTLANGVTTINAADMAVGTGKGTATLSGQAGGRFILGADATLNLYGLTGSGSRATLVAGRMEGFNARGQTGGIDLSGGTANLWLSQLDFGRVIAGQGSGAQLVTGSMTLGSSASNVLNVEGAGSVIRISYNTDNNLSSGTLTINNLADTSEVTSTDNSTAILIANRTGSATSTGTFNFNGGTLNITTTGAAIAGGGGTSTLNLSGGATLIAGASSSDWIHSLTNANLNAGGATIDTNGFDLGVSQAFSGAGGLTKDGAGTLTLSATNTYNGATLVSGGTLIVNGALANTSSVTVESGATLGGTGPIGGDTTIYGTHSPGSSPGIITHGNLTYASDITGSPNVIWELTDNTTAGRGTNFDGINVNGDLNFATPTALDLVFNLAGSQVDWSNPFWDNDYIGTNGWLLYQVSGTTSNFGNLSINSINWEDGDTGLFNDAPWGRNFGLHLDDNNIYLTYTPEPSKSVLLALGLISLLARRRR